VRVITPPGARGVEAEAFVQLYRGLVPGAHLEKHRRTARVTVVLDHGAEQRASGTSSPRVLGCRNVDELEFIAQEPNHRVGDRGVVFEGAPNARVGKV